MTIEKVVGTQLNGYADPDASLQMASMANLYYMNLHRNLNLRNRIELASSRDEINGILNSINNDHDLYIKVLRHRQLILDGGKMEYKQLTHQK